MPGGDAPNCVSGVKFLEAFNSGRLQVAADRVVCVGGGDTSIDVVSVARRLGRINRINPKDRPEMVVHGFVAHDVAVAAARTGAAVTLTSLLPRSGMTAAEHEVEDALKEGVTVLTGVMPIEVVLTDDGRARALRLAECDMVDGRPVAREGTEIEIEADLVVSAIGQGGSLEGLEEFDNGRGLIDADAFYRVTDRPGHFVAGDIIPPAPAHHRHRPGVHRRELHRPAPRRPESEAAPEGRRAPLQSPREACASSNWRPRGTDQRQEWGTCFSNYAVHNYEDRSAHEIVVAEDMFLGHFPDTPRHRRGERVPSGDAVLGHFEERIVGLGEEQAMAEAGRCMSCGLCFECDNCVIYCPQDAVFRVKKDKGTTGRYVDTDYAKCIGCHICADVCPSGYIDMGMGE